MNLKLLQYFIQVAELQSFTKASKELFICQSALSKAVKSLELELDITLIDRSSKKFKLTPEGHIFYKNGKIALNQINEQLSVLLDTINLGKGKIKVGVPPVISTIYFTSIIHKFKELYPFIDLNIIEAGANTIKDKVHNGEIDIGVVILPFESDDFNITRIFNSEIVAVVHKLHPFAQRSCISIEDIKDQNVISLDETYMLYDRIHARCRNAGFEPKIICTSSQWDFIAEMVSLNQGITFLPKPILSKFHSKNIRLVNIKEGFPWNIAFITRKDKYITKTIKLFIEFTEKMDM